MHKKQIKLPIEFNSKRRTSDPNKAVTELFVQHTVEMTAGSLITVPYSASFRNVKALLHIPAVLFASLVNMEHRG